MGVTPGWSVVSEKIGAGRPAVVKTSRTAVLNSATCARFGGVAPGTSVGSVQAYLVNPYRTRSSSITCRSSMMCIARIVIPIVASDPPVYASAAPRVILRLAPNRLPAVSAAVTVTTLSPT